jgi:predicted lipoprotein with Yx(FWY)xxD motif
MTRMLQIASCTVGLLLAAACSTAGPSGPQKPATGYGDSAGPVSTAAAQPAEPAGIATAQNPKGLILTDSRGRAVYLFEADKGTASTCTDACAKEWPPLTTTGAPTAAAGLNAGLLGTSARPDGTTQVTFNGHPLYYYDDDHGPGTTEGQGESSFGAKWYLLTPAGRVIDDD